MTKKTFCVKCDREVTEIVTHVGGMFRCAGCGVMSSHRVRHVNYFQGEPIYYWKSRTSIKKLI